MNAAMEWHDSELVAVNAAAEGEILLDAYVHRKVEAGDAVVEGGIQRVRISVSALRFEGLAPEMPALINHGILVLGGIEHNSLAPLPMRFAGEVRLSLMTRDDGSELLFSGTGITIEAEGEFQFVETVPFNSLD